MLVAPQTYMNRSGYAVRCLTERFEVAAEDCLVVYDEVHLPLGRMRLRTAGSPGGHRGMESIVNNLRSRSVPRLRLGVGPDEGEVDGEQLAEYVLEPFRADEEETVQSLVTKAADACEAWLEEDPERVMNRFNG